VRARARAGSPSPMDEESARIRSCPGFSRSRCAHRGRGLRAPARAGQTRHHLASDQATGVAASDTFEWNERKLHGIAWAQIEGGLIRRFREYQYASELEWDAFIGGFPR
jgi:hypothetical protein